MAISTNSTPTSSNAGQFTNILDNVVQDLNGYLDNSLSATDIATNFQNYTNRLEKLESNQKLLNPDSSNESSNKWFLMAIDNLINGVDYIGSGVETNYLPTLESGIEFVEMATENIGEQQAELIPAKNLVAPQFVYRV